MVEPTRERRNRNATIARCMEALRAATKKEELQAHEIIIEPAWPEGAIFVRSDPTGEQQVGSWNNWTATWNWNPAGLSRFFTTTPQELTTAVNQGN